MNLAGQAAIAAAAAREGGEEAPAAETAGVPAGVAVTARAADAETLCPAAVIVARAVEAVLYGSTSAFGDGGSATASEVVTPAPETVGVVGVGGEKSGGLVVEGGEGSQEERARYREILEGLGKAHAALGRAIESAAESSCAPADAVDDAAAAATKGHETAAGLPADAKVLPPASQWQFRCSSGGEVETEVDKKEEENEERHEGLPQVKDFATKDILREFRSGWCTGAAVVTRPCGVF